MYGRVSYTFGQPRQARAHVRQALELSEKLAIPLRIAQNLSLLAELDILCDQMEDCRVKVDSLSILLKIHDEDVTLNNLMDRLKISPTKKKSNPRKLPPESKTEIYQDDVDEENIREADQYQLNKPSVKGLIIREPDRIKTFSQPIPLSPSIRYREQNFIPQLESCPLDVVNCLPCSDPTIQVLASQLSIFMAYIHCQEDQSKEALLCLNQATHQFSHYESKLNEIEKKTASVLTKAFTPPDLKLLKVNPNHNSFLKSTYYKVSTDTHHILHLEQIQISIGKMVKLFDVY